LRPKTTSVVMRIFQLIIPFHVGAVLGVTADQLDRFRHHIDRFGAGNGDPVLGLQSEDALHRSALPVGEAVSFPSSPPASGGEAASFPFLQVGKLTASPPEDCS